MIELDKVRNQIDQIDMELLALFEKRMEKVLEIGEYKRKNRLPVFNKARELEVLEKNIGRLENKDFQNEAKDFFNKVMEISRDLQRKHIIKETGDGFLSSENISKYHSCGLDKEITIGYQGQPGSFSQEALAQYFGTEVDTTNVGEFEDIFKALERNEIDYGVIPIENSSTGGIAEVYDLLKKYGFYIVGEKCIKVEHNLVGLKGTKLNEICEVYSHPQAFKQCREFLKNYLDFRLIPFKNTATSAKYINEDKSKNKAAICSKKAAELYDLEIIKENINYNKKNYTRFIIIGKNLEINGLSNKISIVTTTAHTPGALYRILEYFHKNNLNMMKLESRPILDRSWEYFFHIDFSGNLHDDSVKRCIEEIIENSTYFKLLGNYVGDRVN